MNIRLLFITKVDNNTSDRSRKRDRQTDRQTDKTTNLSTIQYNNYSTLNTKTQKPKLLSIKVGLHSLNQ